MRKIAPRLSSQAYAFMESTYSTVNAACEYTLDALPSLYQLTIQELKGKFSKAELALLLEATKEIKIVKPGSGSIAGHHISSALTSAYQLRSGDIVNDYSVTYDSISQKIESLTSFQRYVLEIWLDRYKKGGFELNEYIAQLNGGGLISRT